MKSETLSLQRERGKSDPYSYRSTTTVRDNEIVGDESKNGEEVDTSVNGNNLKE